MPLPSHRLNQLILLVDAIGYAVFCSLWDVNTVIPVFLDSIGLPAWLVGTPSTIKQLGYLAPQLLIASRFYRIRGLSSFIRRVFWLDRPQLLLFPLLLLFVGDTRVLAVAFFVGFTILAFGEGAVVVPWIDLMSRSLTPGRRGRFWGLVQAIGGLGVIGAGVFISRVLNRPDLPFPSNFAAIFGLGAVVLLPSLVLFRYASDPPSSYSGGVDGFRRSMRSGLNNRQFVMLLLIQHLSAYDSLAIPYYLVMVRHSFPELGAFTGSYVLLGLIGGVLGGLAWGVLSDKLGRNTIVLITLLKAITALIFLTALTMDSGLALAYLLALGFTLEGAVTSSWVGFTTWVLNLANQNERPAYIAISNAFLLPTALLPVIGGLIMVSCGGLRLCLIAALATAAAFLVSLSLRGPGR